MTKRKETIPSELLEAAEEFHQSEQERVKILKTEMENIYHSMWKLQKSYVIEINNPVNCDRLVWKSDEGNVKSFLVDVPGKDSKVKLKSDEQKPDGFDIETLEIFVTNSRNLEYNHLTVTVGEEVKIEAETLDAQGTRLPSLEEAKKINMTNNSFSDLTMKSLRLEMAENAVLYAKAQLLGEIRTATTRMQGKRVVEIISPATK